MTELNSLSAVLYPSEGIIHDYHHDLLESGFRGDISLERADRFTAATDNSIYQVVPQAVIFPKNRDDIQRIYRLVSLQRYRDLHVACRGGGTGTNGQSLNGCLIIDMRRYLNHIIELDVAAQQAVVQPGVVRNQLNAAVAEDKLHFAPVVAPAAAPLLVVCLPLMPRAKAR